MIYDISKCCGTAVRTVGHTSMFYVCSHCNKPTDLLKTRKVEIESKL